MDAVVAVTPVMLTIHTVEIIAPTLPMVAAIPWLVVRICVGKISPATSQVVQLGPIWLKYEER